jgi:hypothetical protein
LVAWLLIARTGGGAVKIYREERGRGNISRRGRPWRGKERGKIPAACGKERRRRCGVESARVKIGTRMERMPSEFAKLLESKISCFAKFLRMPTSIVKLLEMLLISEFESLSSMFNFESTLTTGL